MYKLLNFVIFLFLLFTPYAFAQSIFDPTAKPGAASGSSLSASDFKNSVSQMGQQTTNNLNQQAKQAYPKTQPPKGTTPQGALPTDNQQATTPSTVDNSFSVNSGTAPTKAQPGTATPSQPSDTYSGFGGGTKSNKSNPPASSGNSGGWNINY